MSDWGLTTSFDMERELFILCWGVRGNAENVISRPDYSISTKLRDYTFKIGTFFDMHIAILEWRDHEIFQLDE